MTNPTRAHPVVVIYTNLIGYKTQNRMETAKYVELLATIFLCNGIGILMQTDHPSKLHDAKIKII